MKKRITFGGLWNLFAESLTPEGRAFAGHDFSTDKGWLKVGSRYVSIGSRTGASASDVCFGFKYGKFDTNEVQKLTVTGGPTGGTVVLRSPIQGATNSATIPWDAYPSDLQTAVVPWTNFADGELYFYGGPWPNEPIFVAYKGQYSGASQSLLTLQTNSLSGGSVPTVAISEYVAGGVHEGFLAVIQPNGTGTCTLYWVTSSDTFATTTWTSIATGLAASEWRFLQFEDKILAVNQTDGITWYQIGGAWNGSAGIPSVQNPVVAPTMVPVRTDSANSYDFTGATFGNYVGWGSNPTVALDSNNRSLKITLAAAIEGATASFDVTLPSASDWSRQDYYLEQVWPLSNAEIVIAENSLGLTLVNNDGSPATLTPAFFGTGVAVTSGTLSKWSREFHWGSQDRNLRDNVIKVRLNFTFVAGTSGKYFHVQLFRLDTWPNDRMDTLDVDAGATLASAAYAYTYQKASTGAESKLSPLNVTQKLPSNAHQDGVHITVTATGSSQLTTGDYINFYRKDRFGNWRFIGQSANVVSGTTTFTDKNMLDELDSFPLFGTIQLPGGYRPSQIGLFKQSPVIGGDRKVWLAAVGDPFTYAPDPENKPATEIFDAAFADDANAARTVYMSLDRTQRVQTITGQDALYLGGIESSVAMTGGDVPQELSPPRPLPGSRGVLGSKAADKLSGGALQAAKSALWYYAVSLAFTGNIQEGSIVEKEYSKEIRDSWSDFVGTDGTAVVVCVFNEETWCFNGAKFLHFTRNEQWEQGTFADTVFSTEPTQANGLIFISNKGEMFKIGDYTTDDGAAVAAEWISGLMEGERTFIESIECHYQGTPYVVVEAWDGLSRTASQRFDLTDGKVKHFPTGALGLLQGWRYRVTVGCSGSDVVESLYLNWKENPGGKGS